MTVDVNDVVKVNGERRALASLKPGENVEVTRATRRYVVKDQDIIYVNGERHLLEELEAGRDMVEITTTVDPVSHKVVQEIHATRPGRFATGTLRERQDATRTIVLTTGEDSSPQSKNPQTLAIFVPADLKQIFLNGEAKFQKRPVTLTSLVRGDRLKVSYDVQENPGSNVNVANKLEAMRPVELDGVLAENFDGRLLSVIQDDQQVLKLPFAAQYSITINGQPQAKPASLQRGDRVNVTHDIYITKVLAQRTLAAGGVIEQIRYEPPQSLSVTEDGGAKPTFLVGPQCKITLGDETVPLDALRSGDRVKIEHGQIDSNEKSAITAAAIAAERPADPALGLDRRRAELRRQAT